MARRPTPIKPLKKQAREYDLDIRAAYLTPFVIEAQNRLARVVAAREAMAVLDGVTDQLVRRPGSGVPAELIDKHLRGMAGWHRDRMRKSFARSLGIDIRPYLQEREIMALMQARIAENVDLIKTIPTRFHDTLKADMQRMFANRPFDQKELMDSLADSYRSSGYNLRRLTRDQTSKTIGQLTEVRHKQVGIERYEWLSSQDERVRPEHAANDGKVFAWGQPPPTGHPGAAVLCRCSAIPIIDPRRINTMTPTA